jgi:hypothetical protein
MKAFLDQMRSVLPEIDMVIEVRDARLPLTSINPHLEELTDQAWGRNWREEMKLAGRLGGIAPPKEGEGSQPGGVWRGRKRLKLVVYTKRDLAEERMEIVSRKEIIKLPLDGVAVMLTTSCSPSLSLFPVALPSWILFPALACSPTNAAISSCFCQTC